MALEAVVYAQPQDHFGYGPKDSPYTLHWCDMAGEPPSGEWDPSLLASLVQSMGEWEHWEGNSMGASPERDAAAAFACAPTTPTQTQKRKRRRTKNVKDKEEAESQRMTHIAVERNRRRQMNEYLAVLRSLMPPSYAQRGDQASIVGGAINYVRELEQLLQSLEVQKSRKESSSIERTQSPFASFFTSPQYCTSAASHGSDSRDDALKIEAETMVVRPAAAVDIEASIVEGHANVKVQAPRRPRQLLKLATGFQRLGLTILHLNVTTADAMVLYSFSLKMEDECKLGSVEEIAAAVHEILGRIQEEAVSP